MFVLPTLVYTLLGATIAWASTPPADGVNCKGSSRCNGASYSTSQDLVTLISQIRDDAWYKDGQQIACSRSGVCAFLQNTAGSNGQWIKMLAPYIQKDCVHCGSVAYYVGRGDYDVSDGELTFNFVTNPCIPNGQPGIC